MLLFHKRTKKVIKYVWGFISVLIVLSMVVTYSGFTMLARTPSTTEPPVDIPQEALDMMKNKEQSSEITPEMQAILDAAKKGTSTKPVPPTAPVTPPVQKLDFSL